MDGYPLNELFKCLAFISTGLAAVWLLLYSAGRCLRRLRVRQEYAAALVLMRAPSAMRDALCACRTHIVEAGEAPPGHGRPLDSLIAVEAAVRAAAPSVVRQYRAQGVLTWRLLYEMEAQLLAYLAATGQHSESILTIIRAPDNLKHRGDEHPASLEGLDLIPLVFQAIEEAWCRDADDNRKQHAMDGCESRPLSVDAAVPSGPFAVYTTET
ncbi:hypothetical protein [Caballeronia sp. Lep1P3]|uniref:DUF2471 family protein n=1 Tax=Caballeronia sp. Lep1P3 TaxID=2878150 RepID=UPI001FD5F3F9|nr:hypothetical protein [Caballeronia sp. Lep1P3]